MLQKITIFLKIKILIFLFSCPVYASNDYNLTQENDLNYAIQLFNNGEFEKVSLIFKNLLAENTEDIMLNYYYGACLVEQNIFTEETNKYLLKAVSGNSPDKIFYYVGRNFQNKEHWNSALKYYNRFKNYGSEKEKQELNIQELIDFCYSNANAEKIIFKTDSTIKDTFKVSNVNISNTKNIPEPIEQKKTFTPINFQINSQIIYISTDHFKSMDALNFFNEGIIKQEKLSKILLKSDSLRMVFSNNTSPNTNISQKIISLEQESLTLKNQIDQLFLESRKLENKYWDEANDSEIEKFRIEIEKLKDQLFSKEAKTEVKEIEKEQLAELDQDIFISDKPAEDKKEEQEVDNISYKIQIGAYSRGVPDYISRLYKKLSMIRKIDNYTDDRGVTVYTTGNLTNINDAIKMQAQVRQEGVKDAFVVAYKNGKRITLKEAKKLTK